jgi:hypothetical protein
MEKWPQLLWPRGLQEEQDDLLGPCRAGLPQKKLSFEKDERLG